MRRALVLCGALALAALLFLFLRPHPERAAFLPEAQNDFVLGVVGLQSKQALVRMIEEA